MTSAEPSVHLLPVVEFIPFTGHRLPEYQIAFLVLEPKSQTKSIIIYRLKYNKYLL